MRLTIGRGTRDECADSVIAQILKHGDAFVESAWDAFIPHRPPPRDRRTCTWAELADLRDRGATIGSHSVTHCRLIGCSPIRLDFELAESKRVITSRFSECDLFAYPYGTADVVSEETSMALRSSGYRCGFLTHAGFANHGSDAYRLPRIVMPDATLSLGEYRARAQGGQIPFDAAKRLLVGGAV